MVILLVWGCDDFTKPSSPAKALIGYRFYSSLDSLGDSTHRVDEVSQGLIDLFHRLENKSTVHAAWQNWPDLETQKALCNALENHPRVQFRVILDPSRAADSTAPRALNQPPNPMATHPQVVLENLSNPQAGILNPDASPGRMNVNMVLFQGLQPLGPDNGDFTLFLQDASFPDPGNAGITEALRIYGDSSLFERCMTYWEGMRESKTEFTFAKTHTYSNLHDHQAWFFPDILAEKPENAIAILAQLEDGMIQTHQPAKIRLALTGADACHLDFFQMLMRLGVEYEADVRVVLKDTSTMPQQVVTILRKLPEGSIRLFPARDSSHRYEMYSRFLLVDGPYVVTKNDPAEPRRMCFFFGDDLALVSQRDHSAIWLRIADERVFAEMETHWNKLWKLSEDKPVQQASRIKWHGRCFE